MSWHLQVDEVVPRAVIGAKMAALANDGNSELLLLKRLAHKNELAPPSTPLPPPFLVMDCPPGDPTLSRKKRMASSPICMSQARRWDNCR